MASTGAVKWKKYFSHDKVETTTKGKAVVKDAKGATIDTLDNGFPITVLHMKAFNPRYDVAYKKNGKIKTGTIAESSVAKPIAKKAGGALSNITALDFVKDGKDAVIKYTDRDVKVKTFKSSDELIKAIQSGFKTNKKLPEPIMDIFETYLNSKDLTTIKWPSNLSDGEKNKLGVYFGELLVGLLALDSTRNVFAPDPFKGTKIKAFHLPSDPSFSGVDSLFELKDGTFIPVSSKFGTGAAASIFANLVPKGIEYYKKVNMKQSVFKDFIGLGVENGVVNPSKQMKEMVYLYGVRKILGIKEGSGKNQIRDVMKVYEAIRKEDLTDEALLVIQQIANLKGKIDPLISQYLPKSVSSYFNRQIADRLNKDQTSQEQMKSILAGKNFWQANLQTSAWGKGAINFKFLNSGDINLEIIGRKSAIHDIDARQGWINYILKYK